MSIYDRDYAREDRRAQRAFRWPFRFAALHVLMALNVLVFVAWLATGGPRSAFMLDHFTLSGAGLWAGYRVHTLLTYAFSQYEPWHLLFNLIFLWSFGGLVEETYGARNFVWLYVFSALAAAALHLGLNVLRHTDNYLLGASGAAMGIAVACAALYPNRKVLLWGVIPIALKWLAALFVLLDFIFLVEPGRDTIARGAHLGGALAGYLFFALDLRVFDGAGPGLLRRLARLLRRRPRLRVVARSTGGDARGTRAAETPLADARGSDAPPAAAAVDAQTAARVDELLEKIHQRGLGALTAEERDFLKGASVKYRQERG